MHCHLPVLVGKATEVVKTAQALAVWQKKKKKRNTKSQESPNLDGLVTYPLLSVQKRLQAGPHIQHALYSNKHTASHSAGPPSRRKAIDLWEMTLDIKDNDT